MKKIFMFTIGVILIMWMFPNAAFATETYYGRALKYQVTPMSSEQHKKMSAAAGFASRALNALLTVLQDEELLSTDEVRNFLDIYKSIDYYHYTSVQYLDGRPYNVLNALTDQSKSTNKNAILMGTAFFNDDIMIDKKRKGTLTHETFHVLSSNPDATSVSSGMRYYDADGKRWMGSGLNEAMADFTANTAMLLLEDGFEKQISKEYTLFIPIAEWFYENYGDDLFVFFLYNDISQFKADFDAYEKDGWNNFNELLDNVFATNIKAAKNVDNPDMQKKIQQYLSNVTTWN